MQFISQILGKPVVCLYEAEAIGSARAAKCNERLTRVRFFSVAASSENDASELFFPPRAVVGASDAVTLKNRAALKGKFSVPPALATLPIGAQAYSPDGKSLGKVTDAALDGDRVISLRCGDVDHPISRLVSRSDKIVIIATNDEKFSVSPPRFPKTRDDRAVTALTAENPVGARAYAYPSPARNADSDDSPAPASKPDERANSTVFTPSKRDETAVAENLVARRATTISPASTAIKADERAALSSTDRDNPARSATTTESNPTVGKATVKSNDSGVTTIPPVVLPSARRTLSPVPVRATVLAKSDASGEPDGYDFLIGKTATRTILGDDGEVIARSGETITREIIAAASGKLILLALYSR